VPGRARADDAGQGGCGRHWPVESWDGDTAATGIRDARFMYIATRPDYRNRGAAGALIGHALRAAADEGYGRATLQVDSANSSEAFGVYEKAGFTPKRQSVRWALEA
jgi:mycothiol synthase